MILALMKRPDTWDCVAAREGTMGTVLTEFGR